MQNFKGDVLELKFINSADPICTTVSTDKTNFYNSAYLVQDLGGMIYDSGRAPLSNAIDREIFIQSFAEIFDAFVQVGTAEAYLTVFRKVFGEDVDVTFAVPGPGQLNIDIIAVGLDLNNFAVRSIVDNAYVLDDVVTQDDENIVISTLKGFQSQYELEQMLFEMVPAGIYTQISLSI